jgi:hypothetical protein
LLPFGELLNSEQRRIDWILEFPVFHVKKDSEVDEEISQWNAFNLMPDGDRYKRRVVIEYNHKVLCRIAAGDNYDLFKALYENERASEVWEQIAMKKAIAF